MIGLASLFGGKKPRRVAWSGGAGELVLALSRTGEIEAASGGSDAFLGAAGPLVGRSLMDFVAREDRDAVRAALSHALERQGYADPRKSRARFRLLRVRRGAASAEIAFNAAGDRIEALIRERFETGDAPAPSSPGPSSPGGAPSEFRARADDADTKNRLADLSHEMKTPLNAIIGFADAMRGETFGALGDQRYVEYAEHIHAAGAHLAALVGAMHVDARAGLERASPERKPEVSPEAIARECAAMVRGPAQAAGLELKVVIEGEPQAIRREPRVIRQILINLLSNAVKFTEAGEIEIAVVETDAALMFQVRDTGVGMNQVVLAKLGGRFSDTHRDGVRGAEGSGLGLSLAYRLARAEGGALDIESEPGVGTVATLRFPKDGAALRRREDVKSQLDRVNAFRRERAVDAA